MIVGEGGSLLIAGVNCSLLHRSQTSVFQIYENMHFIVEVLNLWGWLQQLQLTDTLGSCWYQEPKGRAGGSQQPQKEQFAAKHFWDRKGGP